eukprot:746551-Hanusia_phi.AAC.8
MSQIMFTRSFATDRGSRQVLESRNAHMDQETPKTIRPASHLQLKIQTRNILIPANNTECNTANPNVMRGGADYCCTHRHSWRRKGEPRGRWGRRQLRRQRRRRR